MSVIILRIIGILAGIALGIIGALQSGAKRIILLFIAFLFFIQGLPPIIDIFHRQTVEISDESIKKIVAGVKEATPEPESYTDGLPTTDNKEIRRLFFKAQEEEARAKKIAEAIRQGNEEAAKQFAQSTLNAIEYYKQGLSANPRTSERCALFNLIGLAHYRISEFDEATAAWEESESLAIELISSTKTAKEGLISQAAALGNLGIVYQIRGDLDKAETMYLKIHKLHEEFDDKRGMASDYGNLGIIYKTRGALDKAEEMYQKALKINEELGHKEGIAIQYGNLGIVYQIRGKLDKAEEMHLKSLAIEEELGHKEGMAADYGNLGIVYQIRGKLDKAEEMYQKALKINEELGRKEGIAIQYGNLGNVYKIRGDLDKAEEYYRQALKLYQEVGAEPMVQWAIDRLREIGAKP